MSCKSETSLTFERFVIYFVQFTKMENVLHSEWLLGCFLDSIRASFVLWRTWRRLVRAITSLCVGAFENFSNFSITDSAFANTVQIRIFACHQLIPTMCIKNTFGNHLPRVLRGKLSSWLGISKLFYSSSYKNLFDKIRKWNFIWHSNCCFEVFCLRLLEL